MVERYKKWYFTSWMKLLYIKIKHELIRGFLKSQNILSQVIHELYDTTGNLNFNSNYSTNLITKFCVFMQINSLCNKIICETHGIVRIFQI